MWIALILACGGKTTTQPSPEPSSDDVVELTTRDGVTLAAEAHLAASGAPGVVLLHMTPRGPNTRHDWPDSFIEGFNTRGWSVVAIDRRGAGDSGGEAVDAFEGEAGRYDVEAAVLHLRDHGLGDLAIIGASNGTTSMIDYAVWADGEGLPPVTAMGFMTGGTYTENQTAMAAVPEVPAIFTYSTAERDWSVTQQDLDPGSWVFEEYEDGAHGTKMFDARPEVATDLLDFFAPE